MSTASTKNGPGVGQVTDVVLGATRTLTDGSVALVTVTGGDWGATVIPQSATTTIKTGAGQLGTVIVGTATGNITIYDNTAASGTKIYDTAALVVGPIVFNCSFTTGLTIVLSGAGVATVLFR